jgi:DNA-binding response OmpR family regulator
MATPLTILIADDDPRLRKVVGRALELEGYHAITAADGHQALDLALHESIDLLILDITMPGPDGFSVAQQVRAVSPVPILLITALTADAGLTRRLVGGADDYLLKPFGIAELAAHVAALLHPSPGPDACAVPAA